MTTSAAELVDINRWWSGPLLPLRGCLQFGEPLAEADFEIIPLVNLKKYVPTFIAAAQQFYRSNDERALLSQWSKRYLRVAIAAGCMASLCSRRPLHMALTNCVLRTGMGVPESIWLPHDALGQRSDNPAQLYRSLCVDHLKPAIEILAKSVQLSPRVLWNNAGNLFELLFGITEEIPALATTTRIDRDRILNGSDFFNTGFRNPLREPVRYITPHSDLLPRPMRVRRQCCLRNRITGEALCSACPHLLSLDDDELCAELE